LLEAAEAMTETAQPKECPEMETAQLILAVEEAVKAMATQVL
jgi:hypothetical protein